MKKRSAKPKGGSIHVGKPTKQMIKEVPEMNAGKKEVRIDYRTVVLVDIDEFKEKGAQRIINEFNGIYHGPV